jgi:hypothetical protein
MPASWWNASSMKYGERHCIEAVRRLVRHRARGKHLRIESPSNRFSRHGLRAGAMAAMSLPFKPFSFVGAVKKARPTLRHVALLQQ